MSKAALVGGHIVRAMAKAAKNCGFRALNGAARHPFSSFVIDMFGHESDDAVDAMLKALGNLLLPANQAEQQREFESIANADPVQLEAAANEVVAEEAAELSSEHQAQLAKDVVHRLTVMQANLRSSPGAQVHDGRSILRPGFTIENKEQLADLLKGGALIPGDLVGGRFKILKFIARGGMGEVYEAEDEYEKGADRQVALKALIYEGPDSWFIHWKFRCDWNSARKLSHLHIGPIHHLFLDNRSGLMVMSMDLLKGVSLATWLERRPGGVTLDEFATIAKALCSAMQYAHDRGVWHLDLKPGHVIVTEDLSKIWVIDFGWGKAVHAAHMLQRVAFGYTAYYTAPEMLAGKPVDCRADVFALGAIFFELLTSRMSTGTTQSVIRLRPDVPQHISDAIMKAMNEDLEGDRARTGKVEELLVAMYPATPIPTPQPAPKLEVVVPSRLVFIPPKVEALRHGMQESIELAPGVSADFIYIDPPAVAPNGFLMGSPPGKEGRSDAKTQQTVILTQPYWLQKTPTTQQQWESVMGNNPAFFKLGPNYPVESVSWDDCQEFIAKLRSIKLAARLPTEAEWEFACRAGTTTPFSCGATISTEQANYNGNYVFRTGEKGTYREKTTPVGSFPANPWGLIDMHGNVWEWCQDWMGDYDTKVSTDPTGNLTGRYRALRGGCWRGKPTYLRSAFRGGTEPAIQTNGSGLRLCLDSPFAL